MSSFLNLSSGGGGGGTINGTATSPQVAYGTAPNTLGSDAKFLRTTTSFSVGSTVAAGQETTIGESDNILGFGILGSQLISVIGSDNFDGIVTGDFTSAGGSIHQTYVGNLNTAGGPSANSQYQLSDVGGGNFVGRISHQVKDYLGNSYQVQVDPATGFQIGNYNMPLADGTNGQVMTTDGGGNVTWQNGGGTIPDLTQVLNTGQANSGLSIIGTNFLQTNTIQTSIVTNSYANTLIGTDSTGNVYMQGVAGTGANPIPSIIGFTPNGNPLSTGFYSTLGTGFVYTPVGSPALDDLTVTGTYTGILANPFYRIDSNNSYYVDVTFIGPSSFGNNITVTWNSGADSATIQNYVSGNTIELTNCTTAPTLGDTLDDGGGNTATVSNINSGPFDTYSWNDGFGGGTFFNQMFAGTPGAANEGTVPIFSANIGHTIGDEWVATGANSAAVQGLLLSYSNMQFMLGDTTGALNSTMLDVRDNEQIAYLGTRSRQTFGIRIDGADDNIIIGDRSSNPPIGFSYYGPASASRPGVYDGFVIDKLNNHYSMGNTAFGYIYAYADTSFGNNFQIIGNAGNGMNASFDEANARITLQAGSTNVTQFLLQDATKEIKAITTGTFGVYGFGGITGDRGMNVDNNLRKVVTGDVDADFNGTITTTDDLNQTFSTTAVHVRFTNLQPFADNASAITGGLVAGDAYLVSDIVTGSYQVQVVQ